MCRYEYMGTFVERVLTRLWKPSLAYYLLVLSVFAFTPSIDEFWAFRINTDKFRLLLSLSGALFVWFVVVVRGEMRVAREEGRNPFGD